MIEFEVYTLGAISNIPAIVYWILLAVLVVGVAVIWLSQRSAEGRILGLPSVASAERPPKGRKKTQRAQKIAQLMLVEWVGLIFCSAVIFRETRPESAINLVPLSSYFCIAENSYLKEVTVSNLLNVALFVPIGFLLGCGVRGITWQRALTVGAMLSVIIELLQLVFCKGLCETDDVIHNMLGCLLGYGIVTVWRHLSSTRSLNMKR